MLELITDYLNKGRTLIMDDYYTSVNLVHIWLNKEIHMVGTLRKNSKGFPKDITNAQLKKGRNQRKRSSSQYLEG